MDTTDKNLVSQINERFLTELAKEPGIDPRLVEELGKLAADGHLSTEGLILQIYERLAANTP